MTQFNFNEIIAGLLRALREHAQLPVDLTWAPLAAAGIVIVSGLVLMARGARWGPGLAALAFLAAGGVGGWALAAAIGVPVLLGAGLCGTIALVLGVAFFRLWQAGLLAACFVAAGLSVYTVRDLAPAVQDWADPPPPVQGGLLDASVLAGAGEVVLDDGRSAQTLQTKLAGLWTHLNAQVPSFATTFWGIVIGATVIGLIVGWVFPRVSRALWAASIGTAMLISGVGAMLQQHAPAWLDTARANGQIAWILVGIVWLVSVMMNYHSQARRKARHDDPQDVSAAPVTA